MNKPALRPPRRLGELLDRCLGETFARQGFASMAVVTHWADIVGEEIAALAEPVKLQWPRTELDAREPATLVLRVEGPAAIEIQHLTELILERINRFFGWRAVRRVAIRQAPLNRKPRPTGAPPPAREASPEIRASVSGVGNEALREALARLGAAIKRT